MKQIKHCSSEERIMTLPSAPAVVNLSRWSDGSKADETSEVQMKQYL